MLITINCLGHFSVVHKASPPPPSGVSGVWKKKTIWKPRWIKEWKSAKVMKPIWRKIWSPVLIKEWVPVPKPPPNWDAKSTPLSPVESTTNNGKLPMWDPMPYPESQQPPPASHAGEQSCDGDECDDDSTKTFTVEQIMEIIGSNRYKKSPEQTEEAESITHLTKLPPDSDTWRSTRQSSTGVMVENSATNIPDYLVPPKSQVLRGKSQNIQQHKNQLLQPSQPYRTMSTPITNNQQAQASNQWTPIPNQNKVNTEKNHHVKLPDHPDKPQPPNFNPRHRPNMTGFDSKPDIFAFQSPVVQPNNQNPHNDPHFIQPASLVGEYHYSEFDFQTNGQHPQFNKPNVQPSNPPQGNPVFQLQAAQPSQPVNYNNQGHLNMKPVQNDRQLPFKPLPTGQSQPTQPNDIRYTQQPGNSPNTQHWNVPIPQFKPLAANSPHPQHHYRGPDNQRQANSGAGVMKFKPLPPRLPQQMQPGLPLPVPNRSIQQNTKAPKLQMKPPEPKPDHHPPPQPDGKRQTRTETKQAPQTNRQLQITNTPRPYPVFVQEKAVTKEIQPHLSTTTPPTNAFEQEKAITKEIFPVYSTTLAPSQVFEQEKAITKEILPFQETTASPMTTFEQTKAITKDILSFYDITPNPIPPNHRFAPYPVYKPPIKNSPNITTSNTNQIKNSENHQNETTQKTTVKVEPSVQFELVYRPEVSPSTHFTENALLKALQKNHKPYYSDISNGHQTSTQNETVATTTNNPETTTSSFSTTFTPESEKTTKSLVYVVTPVYPKKI